MVADHETPFTPECFLCFRVEIFWFVISCQGCIGWVVRICVLIEHANRVMKTYFLPHDTYEVTGVCKTSDSSF